MTQRELEEQIQSTEDVLRDLENAPPSDLVSKGLLPIVKARLYHLKKRLQNKKYEAFDKAKDALNG